MASGPLRDAGNLPSYLHTMVIGPEGPANHLSVKLGVWGGHRPRLHSEIRFLVKGALKAPGPT